VGLTIFSHVPVRSLFLAYIFVFLRYPVSHWFLQSKIGESAFWYSWILTQKKIENLSMLNGIPIYTPDIFYESGLEDLKPYEFYCLLNEHLKS
jgi:hypothetical protein